MSFLFTRERVCSCACSGDSGNWIEIAYGTSSGTVRVIVQHPETVGSGPQLFQTFSVHRSPVTKIMLSEKHLISGKEGCFLMHIAQLCIVNTSEINFTNILQRNIL